MSDGQEKFHDPDMRRAWDEAERREAEETPDQVAYRRRRLSDWIESHRR